MLLAPVLAGAVHDTVALAFPAIACTFVGGPGFVAGIPVKVAEGCEEPLVFCA